MVRDPIHHRTPIGAGRVLTVEWEPLAEWHSRWVASDNVTGRRTVLARCATFTEARLLVSRTALEHRSRTVFA